MKKLSKMPTQMSGWWPAPSRNFSSISRHFGITSSTSITSVIDNAFRVRLPSATGESHP